MLRARSKPLIILSKTSLYLRNASNVASTISYNRKGTQPSIALLAAQTITKLSSGITIATHDNHGPASSVAIVLKSGSRYDTTTKPGVAHLIQRSLLRNLPNDSVTRCVLDTEMRGNTLYSTLDREYLTFGSEFLRDDLVDVVPLLVDNLFNPSHEIYEFKTAVEATLNETVSQLSSPLETVMALVHQVSYHTALGNPIHASAEALDELTRSDLSTRINSLGPADITVVGTGVNHADLTTIVDEAFKPYKLAAAPSPSHKKAEWYGGEARVEGGPSSEAVYAVAWPGVAYTSPMYAASLVLKAILGGDVRVHKGAACGMLGGSSEAKNIAFGSSYTDSGIMGFIVTGETDSIKSEVQAGIKALKNISTGGLEKGVVEAARKKALVDNEMVRDKVVDLLVRGGKDFLNDIENVTAADVQKVAKAMVSGKMSVVAYGNLLRLPYANEL